jgi:hypothetical protein
MSECIICYETTNLITIRHIDDTIDKYCHDLCAYCFDNLRSNICPYCNCSMKNKYSVEIAEFDEFDDFSEFADFDEFDDLVEFEGIPNDRNNEIILDDDSISYASSSSSIYQEEEEEEADDTYEDIITGFCCGFRRRNY